MQRGAELGGVVVDHEAQVDLFVDRHRGPEAVGLHAHADHDDARPQRHARHNVLDHSGYADALEDDRPLRGGADLVAEFDCLPPRQAGDAAQDVHGVECGAEQLACAREVFALLGGDVPRGVDSRVDDDVGAATSGKISTPRRQVGGYDGLDALGLENQDHRQSDRSAAHDDGDVALAHATAVDGVHGHRQRFGQRGVIEGHTVGHGHRHVLGDDDVLGVGAGGVGAESDEVLGLAVPDDRQSGDQSSRRPLLATLGAVLGDLADELVAHHDVIGRAHEAVVTDLGSDVGGVVAVRAGVQIRAADPGAPHLQQHLTWAWLRRLDLFDAQLALVTHHCPHRLPLVRCSNTRCNVLPHNTPTL